MDIGTDVIKQFGDCQSFISTAVVNARLVEKHWLDDAHYGKAC